MSGFDKYAYYSKITSVRASDKLMFTLIPLMICLWMDDYIISLIIMIVMGFCTVICSGIQIRNYIKLLTIPLSFLLIGTLTVIINQLGTADTKPILAASIFRHTYGITRMSLITGVKLICKAMAAVICLYFFSINTTMNSFFSLLRRSRFPVILIELMELIYRFIFVIWSEADKIYIAQSSRLGYKSFTVSLRSLGALGSTIFMKALGRADRMNHALEARGFNGRFEYLATEEKNNILLRYGGPVFGFILLVIAIMLRT